MRNIWWAVRSSLCNQRSVCLRYPYSSPDVYISPDYLRSSSGYPRRTRATRIEPPIDTHKHTRNHAHTHKRERTTSLYSHRFYKFHVRAIKVPSICSAPDVWNFHFTLQRERRGEKENARKRKRESSSNLYENRIKRESSVTIRFLIDRGYFAFIARWSVTI